MNGNVYEAVVVETKEEKSSILTTATHFIAKDEQAAREAVLLNEAISKMIRAAKAAGSETEVIVRPFCK